MYTSSGGLFDAIGGIFKRAVNIVTAIPKAGLNVVTSNATKLGQTLGNVGGSIVRGLGITGINIPGIGGATFGGGQGAGGGGGGGLPPGTTITTSKLNWVVPALIGVGLVGLLLLSGKSK